MKARALLVKEDGFTMITVIGVMVVALTFASTAAIASITSLRSTNRDENSKMALAAADAGASAALARQNTIAATGSNSCLTPGTGGVLVPSAPGPDGWCAPVTGSIDGGTYSYQVGPGPDETLRVISTGDAGEVERRIEVQAANSTAASIFAEHGLIGLDSIHMDSNSTVHAGAATNGGISLDSNSRLCGAAQVGIGHSVTLSGSAGHGGSGCAQSSYPVTQEPLTLPGVQQGDVVTNNSNGRFFSQDLIGGRANRVSWNAGTRTLELSSNVSVTLGGSNYSFCRIKLGSNSTLFIAAGATVRMFFDSPEACGNQTVPLEMASNSQITPTTGNPTHVAMLFVGSDSIASNIILSSNSSAGGCASDFVIYAPKTDIQVNSNINYCGAMAGKSVDLDSNTTITSSEAAAAFQLPGAGPHYVANKFLECSVTSPGGTGEGC